MSKITQNEPDEEYQDRVMMAVWKAIILETRDPTTNAAMLRNEDIIDALVTVQAFMLSSSKAAASPTKLREWCTEFSKRLHRRTKEVIASGETPFDHVVNLDERQ